VRSLKIALALLLIAPFAVRAQAVTVAVFPITGFYPGQDGAAFGSSVRDMLVAAMSKSATLKTVNRSSVDELMKSRKLALSGKLPDDQIQQLGGLLGAQYGVTGTIMVAGKDANLSLYVVDIETGVNSHSFSERMPVDQLLSLVEKAGTSFGDLKLPARAVEVVVPVPSLFAYSRGLDYEQRGQKSKAAEMYEAALKIFPENAAAKTALSRVK
jgi:TolB-like protein